MVQFWWGLVILAIFFIGVTKSGFGSGMGLMIVPMSMIAMDHLPASFPDRGEAALPLLLPLLIAGDVLAVWQYRGRFRQFLPTLKRLLPGTIAGVALGGLLLAWFNRQNQRLAAAVINMEIGFESVLLVSLAWYRIWRSKGELPPYRPSTAKSAAVGAFAGASSTLAHAAGPIIALHLLPQRLTRAVFVGTCALYFFILNSSKLPVYQQAGLFEKVSPAFALRFAPLVLAGAVFGYWINGKMNDELFSKVVYAITFALGWYILIRGALMLG